uniref:Uncharacterized protein n=1 Tax=Caenorhabditis japonica TaxID=281687 RepID=A0A8R1EG43_CAEJA
MDSPHASTLMLDGSGTPCMELSPPGMHDFNADSGSLSNLHNHPQMQLMQQQQQQQQQQQSPQSSDYQTNGCNGMNGGGGYYH